MSLLVQAASYLGNYALGSVVYFKFSVTDATGVLTTLGGTPVVKVYKDNNTTESTAGVTLTVDFDSRTGLCQVASDTSSDGTFYSAGSEFEAVLTAGTVGLVSVAGTPVGHFSLLNRVDTLADGVAHGGTPGSSTASLALKSLNVTASAPGATALTVAGPSTGQGLTVSGGIGVLLSSDGGPVLQLSYSGEGNDPVLQLLGNNLNTGLEIIGVGTGLHVQSSTGPAAWLEATDGDIILLTASLSEGTAANGISIAAAGTGHDINLAGSGDLVGKLAANALDTILIDGMTLPAALQIIAALTAGKVSGAGTSTEVFKGLDGSSTRATMTVDASGNRSGASYS